MAKRGRPKIERPPRPRGGVTKFNDAMCTKIIELAEKGCTNEEIADLIGVHRNTLYVWQQKSLDLKVALKQAQNFADELVEASLFRRACGYSHPAEKHFLSTPKYGDPEVITHEYVEHYPPSEAAAIFWLKNRQPERWSDKGNPPAESTPKIDGNTNIIVEFVDESDNQNAQADTSTEKSG